MVSPLTAPVTTAVSAGFHPRILLICHRITVTAILFWSYVKIPLVETTV
jgi:hypothetical protein